MKNPASEIHDNWINGTWDSKEELADFYELPLFTVETIINTEEKRLRRLVEDETKRKVDLQIKRQATRKLRKEIHDNWLSGKWDGKEELADFYKLPVHTVERMINTEKARLGRTEKGQAKLRAKRKEKKRIQQLAWDGVRRAERRLYGHYLPPTPPDITSDGQ